MSTPPPDAPPADRAPADPLRRAALLSTAVLVPLVVVLLVLVNVLGRDGTDDDATGPAEVSGATADPRGDLPPVPVDTPDVTPAADLACPVLMGQLPLDVAGETSRQVQSDSPFAYAWGEPPVVLVCGVAPPAGYVVGGPQTFIVSGVEWFVDTTDPTAFVWTTVDRNVPVQVRVPSTSDSAIPTALSPIIATSLPYVEPTPAPAPPAGK